MQEDAGEPTRSPKANYELLDVQYVKKAIEEFPKNAVADIEIGYAIGI